jgi:hypothetical protein
LQVKPTSAEYEGSRFIMSNDKALFKTHVEAMAYILRKDVDQFKIGDKLYAVERNAISEYFVRDVTRASNTTLAYHCDHIAINHLTYRSFFMSDYDFIFKTEAEAELFRLKVQFLVEVQSIPKIYTVSSPVTIFQEDDVIFDIELLNIRKGTVREVHEWPSGGGFMYYCTSDKVNHYILHSNELIYSTEDSAEIAMYQDFAVHKKFHKDQIIFYAVGGSEVALHRVTGVHKQECNQVYYTQSIDMFFGTRFRSDDRTIFASIEEAQHYNMLRDLEYNLLRSKALECNETLTDFAEISPTVPVSPMLAEEPGDYIKLIEQEAEIAIEELRAASEVAVNKIKSAIAAASVHRYKPY